MVRVLSVTQQGESLGNFTYEIWSNGTDQNSSAPKVSGSLADLSMSGAISYLDVPAMGTISQGDQIYIEENLPGGVKAEVGDLFLLFYNDEANSLVGGCPLLDSVGAP